MWVTFSGQELYLDHFNQAPYLRVRICGLYERLGSVSGGWYWKHVYVLTLGTNSKSIFEKWFKSKTNGKCLKIQTRECLGNYIQTLQYQVTWQGIMPRSCSRFLLIWFWAMKACGGGEVTQITGMHHKWPLTSKMAGCSEKTDSWVNLDYCTPHHSINSVPTGFDVGPTLKKDLCQNNSTHCTQSRIEFRSREGSTQYF